MRKRKPEGTLTEDIFANKILLGKRTWRLENLYHIIDKNGKSTPFILNWAQREINANLWYNNIILKARQIGSTTFHTILLFDACLFNSNVTAGIIAHSLDAAQKIFRKIKYAYEHLPDFLKEKIRLVNDSQSEMIFSNGSNIRVSTTARGMTLNYLLVSEFGKICAQSPAKGDEIVSGSLNSVGVGNFVFIESTAEGRGGHFHRFCEDAAKVKNPTPLDYRLFFFPWYREPSYILESPVLITKELQEYFTSLEKEHGISLTKEQKYWYARKTLTQHDMMKQEYPSLPEEAFEAASDGCYYLRIMNQIRQRGQIGNVPFEPSLPVHTAWDLGISDFMAIWYFQVYGQEIRMIDYDEYSGESLQSVITSLSRKPYKYGTHLGPHDLKVRELTSGMARIDRARELGVSFTLCPNLEIQDGIDAARNLLYKCWFDHKNCEKGIKHLENYSRAWNDRAGCWSSQPLHNESSHAADSFRYLSIGLPKVTRLDSTPEQLEKRYMEAMGLGKQDFFTAPSTPFNFH